MFVEYSYGISSVSLNPPLEPTSDKMCGPLVTPVYRDCRYTSHLLWLNNNNNNINNNNDSSNINVLELLRMTAAETTTSSDEQQKRIWNPYKYRSIKLLSNNS